MIVSWPENEEESIMGKQIPNTSYNIPLPLFSLGLGSVVVFLTTCFALLSGVSEGFAAISVVQAEIFAQSTRALVWAFAQLELNFNG
jgi:hypothetical protein